DGPFGGPVECDTELPPPALRGGREPDRHPDDREVQRPLRVLEVRIPGAGRLRRQGHCGQQFTWFQHGGQGPEREVASRYLPGSLSRAQGQYRVQGEESRRRVGGRVGVRQVAAQRAPVAYLGGRYRL